jgi:plasmid stability protein
MDMLIKNIDDEIYKEFKIKASFRERAAAAQVRLLMKEFVENKKN